MDQARGRVRLEIVLLSVLVLAAGGLAATRLAAPQAPRDLPGPWWGNEAGLGCLKRVVDGGIGGSDLGGADGLEGIADRVERIRGHRFTEVPEPLFLGGQELVDRAKEAVSYPPDRAEADAMILTALGALEPGTDLAELLSDSVGEGVAGYYEPETGELVILGDDDDGLDEIEQVILAHELTHALTDQALGLPSLDDPRRGGEDALFASIALVEGDASLAEAAFSAGGGLLAAVTSIPALATSGVSDLPYHLRRGFTFPYAEGLGFACALYERGGWEAVDAAYEEMPQTTAEILFPERYGRGVAPIDPPDPAGPGDAWRHRGAQAWGAADLLFLFEAPGDDPLRGLDQPLERVRGWLGGEIHLWTKGADAAVAVVLAGANLCGSLVAWNRAAFPTHREGQPRQGENAVTEGPGRAAVVRCSGDGVHVGIGPDLTVARSVAA